MQAALPRAGMPNASPVILHGLNLPKSQVDESIRIETYVDIKQSIVHCHFPMFNGMNADGTYKGLPMVHPTAPATPYLPVKLADDLWQRGQLTLMSWGLRNLQGPNKVGVPLLKADLVAGKYDKFFHESAVTVRKWAHPWVVAINPEFNWDGNISYMPGADFVECWKHIVDIFRAEGATNVTWAWIANQLSKAGRNLATGEDRVAAYYPGDDYVDLVGADVYNRGNAETPTGTWLSLEQILTGAGTNWLGDTYGTITRIAPSKPFVIGEYGSHTGPGDKAAWLRDGLATLGQKFPKVMIASYYQITDGKLDWALKQEDGTAQAYEDAIEEGPYVQGGQFVMPPDLQPITKPFTRMVALGDPAAEATAQLAEVTAQLEGLTRDQASLQLQLTAAQAAMKLAQEEADQEADRADQMAAQMQEVSAALRLLTGLGRAA